MRIIPLKEKAECHTANAESTSSSYRTVLLLTPMLTSCFASKEYEVLDENGIPWSCQRGRLWQPTLRAILLHNRSWKVAKRSVTDGGALVLIEGDC